ncbi:hypothetical protein GCM10010433_27930 [Streptomyces pulveraceus]|uniref:Uncharacterized protein n=1 Tax=Streptomyces pulveraceus TaxID=68258 RepID=A0ABW1GL22_9ACTN
MTGTGADPSAWALLPEGLRPSKRLSEAWLRRLGDNRAAPAEARIGLFDARDRPLVYFLHRDDLPAPFERGRGRGDADCHDRRSARQNPARRRRS